MSSQDKTEGKLVFKKGSFEALQLRCKPGETQIACTKRLEAQGWSIPSDAEFKEDGKGGILRRKGG